MRIQCDVCEVKSASVICCADEAALCSECDIKVHEANKLASKHKRLPLMASSSRLSRCDICQEKTAFVFCLEDRAVLCRDCDESLHLPDTLAAKHQRFLATGIRVALSAEYSEQCPNAKSKEGSMEQGSSNSLAASSLPVATVSRKPSLPAAYVEPCWTVDELLPLSDLESSKGEKVNTGEFDWNIDDMGLLGEDDLAQVPQLSTVSSHARPNNVMNVMNARPGKDNLSSTKGKSKTAQLLQVPNFDETSFMVPDIGMVQTEYFSTIPAKRLRRDPLYMWEL